MGYAGCIYAFGFSRAEFTQEALVYMQAQGMAWTDDETWIQEAVDVLKRDGQVFQTMS